MILNLLDNRFRKAAADNARQQAIDQSYFQQDRAAAQDEALAVAQAMQARQAAVQERNYFDSVARDDANIARQERQLAMGIAREDAGIGRQERRIREVDAINAERYAKSDYFNEQQLAQNRGQDFKALWAAAQNGQLSREEAAASKANLTAAQSTALDAAIDASEARLTQAHEQQQSWAGRSNRLLENEAALSTLTDERVAKMSDPEIYDYFSRTTGLPSGAAPKKWLVGNLDKPAAAKLMRESLTPRVSRERKEVDYFNERNPGALLRDSAGRASPSTQLPQRRAAAPRITDDPSMGELTDGTGEGAPYQFTAAAPAAFVAKPPSIIPGYEPMAEDFTLKIKGGKYAADKGIAQIRADIIGLGKAHDKAVMQGDGEVVREARKEILRLEAMMEDLADLIPKPAEVEKRALTRATDYFDIPSAMY